MIGVKYLKILTLRTQAYTWSWIQIASQRSPLNNVVKRHLCWKRTKFEFEWTSFQNVRRYHIQLKSLSFEIFMRRNSCIDFFVHYHLNHPPSLIAKVMNRAKSPAVKKSLIKEILSKQGFIWNAKPWSVHSCWVERFPKQIGVFLLPPPIDLFFSGQKRFPSKRTDEAQIFLWFHEKYPFNMYLSKYGMLTNPTEA